MTAAEHTRIVLTEFRTLGTPFKVAWANAMRTLPRKAPEYKEWKRALYWARPAFEAYYTDAAFKAVQVDEDQSRLEAAPVDAVMPNLLLQDTFV